MIIDNGLGTVFLAIFIALGVFQVFFPEKAWQIEHGFPQNDEPSDAGILFTRICGIVFIIFGIGLLFMFLFS